MTDRGFICIVARNNIHLTQKAVRSALSQDMPCDVLVIDNASTDGTDKWLSSKREIFGMWMPTQVSLSACWNLALRTAWRIKRTHAMICNNDIEMRPDTYRLLLENGGSFVTGVGVDSVEQRDAEFTENVRESPDFSAFLIRKEVTGKVGWFDEDFFPAFAEDQDFHIRMHKAGIRAVTCGLPFLHHGAGSQTIKNADEGEKQRIGRGADANRHRLFQKHGVRSGSPEYYALFTSGMPDQSSHR